MARRQTPYYHKLVALGAEIVDRIGFDAAYRFSTVEAEHRATREAAGMYDVYHQGVVEVKGREAEAFLNGVIVNDVRRLADGGVLYSAVPNAGGGMIDDLTVYRHGSDHYWLCPTPSRVDVVVDYLTEAARDRTACVMNLTSGTAYLSIQGPRSREILASLTDADLSTAELLYYHFTPWGRRCRVGERNAPRAGVLRPGSEPRPSLRWRGGLLCRHVPIHQDPSPPRRSGQRRGDRGSRAPVRAQDQRLPGPLAA